MAKVLRNITYILFSLTKISLTKRLSCLGLPDFCFEDRLEETNFRTLFQLRTLQISSIIVNYSIIFILYNLYEHWNMVHIILYNLYGKTLAVQ